MNWLRRHGVELGLAAMLALPWLSLFALGLLWLWQNGRVLEWALAAAVLGLLGWPLRVLAQRRAAVRIAQLLDGADFPESGRNAEEAAAWALVVAKAEAATPLEMDDTARPRAEALLRETVDMVAQHFHPGQADAATRTTLPEVLLLTEQVASRMRRWVMTLPGGSRIRIDQALWFQGLLDRHYGRAMAIYTGVETLYRIGRMLNPVQAVAQELQRYAAGGAVTMLGGNMRQNVTRKLVLEAGRAAIDLYSGRLRLSSLELAELARADSATAEEEAPPRLLLVGQAGAGKTSLLNALAGVARGDVSPLPSEGAVREHLVRAEGQPPLNIADMPPLADPTRLLAEAQRADMILWVASATQPGRAIDTQALEALRTWAATQNSRRPPPILVAMTHADRLRPAAEWAPPYAPDAPKAISIEAARTAVAEALLMPEASVLPVALPDGAAPWNVEALWQQLSTAMNAARQARHERLRGIREPWGKEAPRAWTTGRAMLKSMFRR